MLFLSFVGLMTYGSATAAGPATPTRKETSPVSRAPQRLIVTKPRSLPPHTPEHRIEKLRSKRETSRGVPVPFYSQFKDITSPSWQKVGCGIASLAMIIDHYADENAIDVDALLEAGIKSGAYVTDAGWSHAGLIALARPYGLSGQSHSLSHLSLSDAFATLTSVLKDGPVMVSVHYTFEPTNPIPHLVVVNKVEDDRIYYNDPAEPTGNNSISIEKFKRAWKKRYIEIRPQ